MSTATVNTYELVKELVAAGMPERQAEVVVRQQVEVIDENVATKYDISLVQKDIELLRRDLTLKLGGMMVAGFVALGGMMMAVLLMLVGG